MSVKTFETSGQAQIYQISMEVFPGMEGYSYLVLVHKGGEQYRVLIDAGSGWGDSNQQLEAGLAEAGQLSGQSINLANLTHIFITHGHIDHIGGLSYIRPRTAARLGVHELDRRILTNYEERLSMVGRRMDAFLKDAGVNSERRPKLIEMYKMTKALFHSVEVNFSYEEAGMKVGPFEFLHVPGHCAGHVVIRLDDILFTGDHILEGTSPHQSPEHLTLSTGLDHYLNSLKLVRPWARQARLGLGGHKNPIENLEARIEAIEELHASRLQKVMDILSTPCTVSEVSHVLFGDLGGYNVLLALEEAGAHVEYLYQRGLLGIDNLADLETSDGKVPVRYKCL